MTVQHEFEGRLACQTCRLREQKGAEAAPTEVSAESAPVRGRGRPAYCGAFTLVLLADGKHIYRRLLCNTYGCSYCGPRKLRWVRRCIIHEAIERRMTKFWTLTLDPKRLPEGMVEFPKTDAEFLAQVAYLNRCWAEMRVYLYRECGKSIPFIRIVEKHPESGRPHLHLLLAKWILWKWFQRSWIAVGGGEVVHVRGERVGANGKKYNFGRHGNIRNMAGYVASYVTDDKWGASFPLGLRRYSASAGIRFFARLGGKAKGFLSRVAIDVLRGQCGSVEAEEFETEADGAVSVAWFASRYLTPLAHQKFPLFRSVFGGDLSLLNHPVGTLRS